MDKNLKFYQERKVLVTGHTGFKGSWLTMLLNQLNARVTGISLAPKTPDDFFVVNQLERLCKSNIFDIADFHLLNSTISEVQPDIIFHLAAQPLVRQSFADPLETFRTNIIGTANLLAAVRHLRNKCAVVIITTDKVYENNESGRPFTESDRLGGNDPYSASKACAELVSGAFRHSFFNPEQYDQHQAAIATARAGNVIGGGDWSEDRLIPDIVRSIRNGTELMIRNPGSIRPWQHVLDPLYGYLLLGLRLYNEPEKYNGAWNFGPYPEETMNVEEVVKAAIQIMGTGSYKTGKSAVDPPEANLLRLDISKAVNILGWKPQLTTYEAIFRSLEWYREFLTNKEAIQHHSNTSIRDFLTTLQP